jgi:hypothetical protein
MPGYLTLAVNNAIMKRIVMAGLSLFILFKALAQEPAHPLLPATWGIESEELFSVVKELADPKYEGRLTGSPGFARAADYLAGHFAALGLQKPFPESGYFQTFPIPYAVVLPGSSLLVGEGASAVSYHYYDEYMPGSTSGTGDLTAEVIFAGYGISAPELGYDDYAGLDVKGKIVLIRPESPVSPAVGEEKFGPWLPYSLHQYKMQNAVNHGVAGVLYHYGPLANTNNDYHANLLVTMVGNKVVEDLFRGSGKDYGAVVAGLGDKLKPTSFALGKKATMRNRTEYHDKGLGMNVIGILPGSDPVLKNEVIMVGGHLDHCGMCWEVCPGANDNASGIAVLVGAARALAQSGFSFMRTIVFIGIGGEESGLVGVTNYVNNPLFPIDKTVGFINLDCVGIGPNLYAGGGQSFPALFGPVEAANRNFVHRVLGSSAAGGGGRPRSDAAVMIKAGIPSISFSSYGGSGAYHTPGDTPETIWPETLEDLAAILTLALADLAGIMKR